VVFVLVAVFALAVGEGENGFGEREKRGLNDGVPCCGGGVGAVKDEGRGVEGEGVQPLESRGTNWNPPCPTL
jgi:hypothetical protein